MCRKLFFLTFIVLTLGVVSTASAQKGKGYILYEWWYDITGTAITDLTNAQDYPESPDETEWRTRFEGPVNWKDHYGTRARGYVYPPATGNYNFWISGDDFCELWMSTDDDPAKISMIAEVPGWTEAYAWTTYTEQKSTPIALVAGKKYYIEALMKEHEGGDSLTVAWGGPVIGAGPIIIEGKYLSPVIRPMDMLPRDPVPADGGVIWQTWVTLEWYSGVSAVTHDIFFGENLADVEAGTGDTFIGSQSNTDILVGFSDGAYPQGLVPGTTYYWRISEVNDADPESPWVGPVWNFRVPGKTAWAPDPADGAESVDMDVLLKWTPGFGAKLHYIVFGDDYDVVNNTPMGTLYGPTSWKPPKLELAKTYYWRVDEFEGPAIHKGQVWSFTTEGAVYGPNPANGAVDVKPSVILKWNAGAVAASHEVYFGTDSDAVKNATKSSPEYKGPKALGDVSYDPGKLQMNSDYFWRVDEVNGINPLSPWKGTLWRFTTGNFLSIDDFEDYNGDDNQIWFSWHDGLGAGAPGTPGYLPGNGTGSAVGDETTLSYTEETIVHGGNQSMPFVYDNNTGVSKYSEVKLTLSDQRNWTEGGVAELSLWFRGYPASVGSFVEAPTGTYTMVGSGADIWAVNGVEADEFHFAYKMMTGAGTMVAKVVSVDNTDVWAKAGVMIRETLNPDSSHAMMVITPGSGASFQRRPGTGTTSLNTDSAGIVAPYWVKIERSISGNFTGSISTNGTTWTMVGTENIPMTSSTYIGLAVTAHDATAACQAVFTNVTITGNVTTGQWAHQDIGIMSNASEPLYVAVSNSTGVPAIVVHDDPAAANLDIWTEWVIPLQVFADLGINLNNVDGIAIGLGTRGNNSVPGGSGKMYIDDIRLYQPREAAE